MSMTADANEAVVIIGAGIIGIACAHYLAADGRKVIVLDKGTVAGACSHGNCGHVIPSHILPLNSPDALKAGFFSLFDSKAPFRVKPQLRPSFLNWMLQFARHCTKSHMLSGAGHLKSILDSSYDEFEALVSQVGFECDWKKSGLTYVFQSRKAFDAFEKTNTLLTERFDVAAQVIAGNDLTTFDPALKSGLAGGFFYQDDALLRPDMLALTWADQLRQKGVQFVEHCEVRGIEKDATRVNLIKTSKGDFGTGDVILAAGALCGTLAAEFDCDIPVIPGKGYSVTIPRPEKCPKTSLVLSEKNVAITPFSNGLRFGSMMEFVGYDDSVPDHRVRQLTKSADAYLEIDSSLPPVQPWFGWRPMTWDSLPMIGRLPKFKNATIATGHGMLGVMLAPATGRLIAEIIGERPCHIPDAPFSPARFIH